MSAGARGDLRRRLADAGRGDRLGLDAADGGRDAGRRARLRTAAHTRPGPGRQALRPGTLRGPAQGRAVPRGATGRPRGARGHRATCIGEAVGDPGLELLFWLPASEFTSMRRDERSWSCPAAARARRSRRGTLQLATVVHGSGAGRAARSARERHRGRPGWRSRSPACEWRCAGGWPRSRIRGHASSRPDTRSAAGSSATSTTAPSSAWSRSASRSAMSRAGSRAEPRNRISWTPRSAEVARGDRGAARAGARRSPGRARRRAGRRHCASSRPRSPLPTEVEATDERFEDRSRPRPTSWPARRSPTRPSTRTRPPSPSAPPAQNGSLVVSHRATTASAAPSHPRAPASPA